MTTQWVEPAYRDLDSAEDMPVTNLFVGFENFSVQLSEAEPLKTEGNAKPPEDMTLGFFADRVLSAVGGGVGWAERRFEFDPLGLVTATAAVDVRNRVLPRSVVEGAPTVGRVDAWGGRRLGLVRSTARFSLLASDWHLNDGADAEMHGDQKVAGVHRDGSDHGLRRQLRRMVLLGVLRDFKSVPGWQEVSKITGGLLPDPFGTFVVSHNYGLEPDNGVLRGCEHDPGYPAMDGLNNLSKASRIDSERRNCYDTVPFRERAGYSDSRQIQMFRHRGAFFMGCKQAMADDPSEPSAPRSSLGDANTKQVDCE